MGAKVTLKGQQMYDFLSAFVAFVLPRVRERPGRAGHPRPERERKEHEYDEWGGQLRVRVRRVGAVPPGQS